MGFLKDLEGSKKGVEVVRRWYEKTEADNSPSNISELPRPLQHKGDLLISYADGGEKYIEVKFDKMSLKTSNLCFETSNGSKPTGIMLTQADVIAYVSPINDFTYKIFLFHLEALKAYLTSSPKAKLKRGGDKKKFSMYIVSIQDILEDKVCFLSEDVNAGL